MLATINRLTTYQDLDGSPLDNGRVYFGQPLKNPIDNPISVYWDEEGTQPAAQPIRTLNGFLVRYGTPAVIYTDRDYSEVVHNRRGKLVSSQRRIKLDFTSSNLSNSQDPAKGPGLVGFNQSVFYNPETLGRAMADREYNPRNAPWNAKFDGQTDDTAALTGCLMSLKAAGGGTMMMPRGTAICNGLSLVYPSNDITINIRGQGKNATVLKRIDASTAPVVWLRSSSATLPASIQADFSDFSAVGNGSCPGFRTELLARFSMTSLSAKNCSSAFENLGSLIFTTYDCDWLSSGTGYRSRKVSTIRCNRINMIGGTIADNFEFGYDVGDSTGLTVYGADIERNGTNGNVNTGDVVIRNTVDDETSSSQISFVHTHHELNRGAGFTVEAATGLTLELDGCRFDNNESGNSLNVGVIARLSMKNMAVQNTATIAPIVSHIEDSSFTVLNDASTYQYYSNVSSNSGLILQNVKAGALGGISVDNLGVVRLGPADTVSTGDITVKGGNTLLATTTPLVNGAAGNTATLTNSPRVGNPTKWIQINDAGVTRFIPTWTV